MLGHLLIPIISSTRKIYSWLFMCFANIIVEWFSMIVSLFWSFGVCYCVCGHRGLKGDFM